MASGRPAGQGVRFVPSRGGQRQENNPRGGGGRGGGAQQRAQRPLKFPYTLFIVMEKCEGGLLSEWLSHREV
jgi:hypothetical protein